MEEASALSPSHQPLHNFAKPGSLGALVQRPQVVALDPETDEGTAREMPPPLRAHLRKALYFMLLHVSWYCVATLATQVRSSGTMPPIFPYAVLSIGVRAHSLSALACTWCSLTRRSALPQKVVSGKLNAASPAHVVTSREKERLCRGTRSCPASLPGARVGGGAQKVPCSATGGLDPALVQTCRHAGRALLGPPLPPTLPTYLHA